MMTPERRAEIDAMLIRNHDDEDVIDALHDAIVEIDRLNKVVDQVIDITEMALSEGDITFGKYWEYERDTCAVCDGISCGAGWPYCDFE